MNSKIDSDLKVLNHHVYEYRKGLRNLVLHTLPMTLRNRAEGRLRRDGIPYLVYPVSEHKVNVFFGAADCIEVVARFGSRKLNEFTAEEDFILGVMLGYDRLAQCRRYIRRRELSEKVVYC
ncbi:MAG: DUF2023 family protein [Actinomycetia bacterium]|nr:DUF2023 family protein [Actinomycetes bacterium]